MAQAVAAATPCWPAPVSAMMRLLAHVLREEGLAEGVVDLVGAGVGQVLALQVDLRASEVPGEVLCVVEGRRAPDIAVEQSGEAGLEVLVGLDGVVSVLKLGDGGHEGFRDELAAEVAEAAPVVGEEWAGISGHGCSVRFWMFRGRRPHPNPLPEGEGMLRRGEEADRERIPVPGSQSCHPGQCSHSPVQGERFRNRARVVLGDQPVD